jgi:hypothetical protein
LERHLIKHEQGLPLDDLSSDGNNSHSFLLSNPAATTEAFRQQHTMELFRNLIPKDFYQRRSLSVSTTNSSIQQIHIAGGDDDDDIQDEEEEADIENTSMDSYSEVNENIQQPILSSESVEI